MPIFKPELINLNLSAEAQAAASSQSFRVGVKNASGDQPAEIALYGEIGDPWQACDARSVGQFLRDNKKMPVCVRINSPGGLAYDGITIHNALLAHDGPVTTMIEGMAGSAASIIAMAGQPVQIYENAQFFIHRAAVIAVGNRDMMAEAQNWLDKIDEAICRTYKGKTGAAYDKIMAMMIGKVDGTVFTAREAVAAKFCDEVISLKKGATNSSSVNEPKPANCNCDWPETRLRNGSGHGMECPVHKEWEERGGFKQRHTAGEPRSVKANVPVSPQNDHSPMIDCGIEVGDRVVIAGTPHEKGQEAGVVRQVVCGPALGIQFDGMDDIYHWYVPSEVALEDPNKEDQEETTQALRREGEQRLKSVELARAQRIRERRELFEGVK